MASSQAMTIALSHHSYATCSRANCPAGRLEPVLRNGQNGLNNSGRYGRAVIYVIRISSRFWRQGSKFLGAAVMHAGCFGTHIAPSGPVALISRQVLYAAACPGSTVV